MPTPQEIKEARKKAALTQQEMAKIIKCSQSAVEKWERGERNMPQSTFRLFKILTKQERVR